MPLIFPAAILVAGLADLITFKEKNLRTSLACVNLGGQGRGVAELQRDIPFPLRLKGRDVDNNAAARVGAFPEADGQNVAWNAEVLDRARQRERVRWNDADITLEINKRVLVEISDDIYATIVPKLGGRRYVEAQQTGRIDPASPRLQ